MNKENAFSDIVLVMLREWHDHHENMMFTNLDGKNVKMDNLIWSDNITGHISC